MARRKAVVTIPMEDEIIHTVEQPICQEPGCICRQLEYEQLQADMKKPIQQKMHKVLVERNYETADLNYRNRGFRLLK